MNRDLVKLFFATIVALIAAGCGGSTTPAQGKSFEILLTAKADDGQPVSGVTFRSGNSLIGTSDERGRATATIQGSDGDAVPITVTCPDGYVSPEDQPTLRLTHVRRVSQADTSMLNFDAVCTKRMREIVVVVRTNNAPILPVDIAGRSAGETDSNGNAHFKLQLDRDVRTLSVSVGTTSAPMLRPQNPSRVFDLDGRDAILLVEQSFTIDRKRAVKRQAVVTGSTPKHIPYRIGAARNIGY